MKKLLIALLVLGAFVSVYAQGSDINAKGPWENKGQTSLQFAQAAFKNWSSGGTNALSLNALLVYNVNYKNEKLIWNNNVELGYGFQYALNTTQKTDDKVDISSSLEYKAGKHWDYSGMLSFKTQMTKGYSDTTLISNFFAPAYLMLSGGMTYAPTKAFSMLISPLTGKMTMVTDPTLSALGSYGVNPGEQLRGEFGGFAKISFKHEILQNVRLNTKLELFSNYLKDPQYVDVNWDLLISMKINKFLSANIASQLIYDHDINIKHENAQGIIVTGPAVQFKEMFSLGITFIL